jgi:hypothetical protein
MKMNLAIARTAVLLATLVAAGCSRDPLQMDLGAGRASQAVLTGNDQQARAGTELPQPVTVQVLDAAGNGVHNQIVNFVVIEGGGHVYAGAALTDDQGFARDWWTLGEQAGANAMEARAVDSGSGEALVFGVFHATGIAADQTD